MGVAGELTTIGLAEVLQNLAFNRLTGTLTLEQGGDRARLAVEEGRIRAVRVGDRKLDYVEIARHAQAAPEEVLEKAATTKRRRTLKAYLHASGAFDDQAYVAMVAGFVQEEILPLFGWRAGAFQFDEGPFKARAFEKDQLDCGIELDPMAVAMEAARRQDEWAGLADLVPASGDVLVAAEGTDGDVSGDEERLLPLLDGTRPVGAAIKEARLKRYDGLKAAARLVETGRVAPADPARLRELAEQNATRGDVHRAVRQLEAALAMNEKDPEARRALVRLYERAGDRPNAAAAHVDLADLLLELGDLEGAVESYDRAAVLAPRDLDVLERLFQCHLRGGDRLEALRAGRRLAEALLAHDMPEDARPLYERLLDELGGGSGVREAYVQCLLRLDDPAGAARELRVLAGAAYDKGEFDRALRALRRLAELDPECEETTERIEAIESGREQRRRTRRRRGWQMTAMLLAAGLLVAQGAREWQAFAVLHGAQAAAAAELATDNGDAARLAVYGRLAAVAEDHPWTRAAAHAEDALRALLLKEAGRI